MHVSIREQGKNGDRAQRLLILNWINCNHVWKLQLRQILGYIAAKAEPLFGSWTKVEQLFLGMEHGNSG